VERTDATVVGSQSTLNVARAAGVVEQHLVLARGGETFQFGPFSVRAIRALHALDVRALGRPRLVLTNHFDAHWDPLGPSQMSIDDADRADLAAFADEIHACSPETKVLVPTHLRPMAL
jgi:hypothetical protein